MTKRILRLPEVIHKTGRSRSSIYAGMQEGSFPKNINLGFRAIGWLESDINDWIEVKILEAKAQPSNFGGSDAK